MVYLSDDLRARSVELESVRVRGEWRDTTHDTSREINIPGTYVRSREANTYVYRTRNMRTTTQQHSLLTGRGGSYCSIRTATGT